LEFTDEEILKLIASDRDFEKGFSVLVKKYQEKLYWNIRRMVHVHQDADDVLQNVFLKVFKGIKGFKKDAKLFTWLYKISVNESITFLNKKKKKVSLSLEEHVGHLEKELKADTYFNGDDMQLQLIKAIEHLPEKQKLVFNMR